MMIRSFRLVRPALLCAALLMAARAKCHQTATNYTQYCCQSSGCHNSCQGGG